MRRHANCPMCKRRFRVTPTAPAGVDLLLGRVVDVFPEHADTTNGGWCEGSRWIVESEDYASEAP